LAGGFAGQPAKLLPPPLADLSIAIVDAQRAHRPSRRPVSARADRSTMSRSTPDTRKRAAEAEASAARQAANDVSLV
jgi:hypothetical protein